MVGVIVRKQLYLLTFVLSLLFSLNAVADDFEAFKNESNKYKSSVETEFKQYKKELEDGFAAYKNAYEEEFKAYKTKITGQWGEFVDSSRKVWVSYDQSNTVRRSLDFETGELSIDILNGDKLSDKELDSLFQREISSVLNTTEKQAFEKDQVASRVEARLIKATKLAQTAELDDTPLFDFNQPKLSITHGAGLMKMSSAEQVVTSTHKAGKLNKNVVNIRFKIPDAQKNKAQRFSDSVAQAAKKEQIPAPMVLAIMETESSFNPMAKSHIPAFGLMQVVPSSSGKDATRYLYGKAKILSPSYLYKGSNNITVGSAYIHILYYSYLNNIENPISRLYCAIAAYNTGAGNVAKAIVGSYNVNKAARKINQMDPREVYKKLLRNLPYKETRHYLKKVAIRMAKYQHRGI